MPPIDRPQPGCADVRESISADLDGESVPLSRLKVAGHLEGCASCAQFASQVADVTRGARVAAVGPVPDLSPQILAAASRERQAPVPLPAPAGRIRELRALVALAGVAQLLLAMPLIAGMLGPDLHLGRDLAALQLAVGVGLIFAAAQPFRAPGLLPVVAVLAVATVVMVAVDIAAGLASVAGELTHLAELSGVIALWALSRRMPVTPRRGRVIPAGRSIGAA